jgi:YVTN family beta-propeller protein
MTGKMQKKIRNSMLPVLLAAMMVLHSGCKKEEKSNDNAFNIANQVIITNEGLFQTGTGTLSALNRSDHTVLNDLFEQINGRSLVNIVQSFTVYGSKAYIVVNNSNKIEVADAATIKSTGVIEGISLPLYFTGINEHKGYASSFNNIVAVIDLDNLTVTKTIPAGTGPEKMCLTGTKVFVLNRGGYGTDSTITVIDVTTDEVIHTIQVGNNPSGIQQDRNGKLWVICSGKGYNGFPAADDTRGSLIQINPDDYSILKSYAFPASDKHPVNLVINGAGDILFYNYPEGIFRFSIGQDSLAQLPVVARENMFYGIGFDPVEDLIYASDPLDYVQDGWIFRYRAIDGNPVDSFKVGIIPSGFWFSPQPAK